MDIILTLVFLVLGGASYILYKFYINSSKNTNTVTKIDDKTFMVDNKIVSFKENTAMLTLQQKMEDDKHYFNYERKRLNRDRERLANEWIETKKAINNYPDLKDSVTEEKLNDITEKFTQYVFICKKLQLLHLSKEEFLIKEENPIYCADFSNMMQWDIGGGIYNVYNDKTARYYNGKMTELMAKEFQTKWY